jgi:hypothetical protein
VRSKGSTSKSGKKSSKSKSSSKAAGSRPGKKKVSKAKVSKTKLAKEKAALKKSKKVAQASDTSDYALVALDAVTRKVTRPKKGDQVFFAWKSRHGKLYPIESQYSQAYYKTDADGIIAAFKAGSPLAYNVYKQLTKDVSTVLDKDGKPVNETAIDRKTGEVKTLFRWKITGRDLRKAQSVSVHSVMGFQTPLTRGFTPQEPREIPHGGYVKVPVTFGKEPRQLYYLGRFTGDSIRDTLSYILPDVTTEELARRGIKVLGVDGYVDAYRPENPYAEESLDWEDREKWANKIWKDSKVRRFRVAAAVPSLMDFASRVSTAFRTSFSSQGLRVTSLLELEDAEERQRNLDETVFKLLDPVWPSIIENPRAGVRYKLSAPGREGQDVPARKYFPMRYEADGESATDREGSKYETVLALTLSIKGF